MNKIKEEVKENIWIIETGATEKRFIENLVYPVKIDSINLVWLPDGNKLTKIVISEKRNKNKIVEEVKIKGIASKIKNIELLIEYVKK
jgi:transcription antitermination factor NusA-like protein